MNELGKLLRHLRGKESLRDVADRAGISHSYLSHLEKGKDPRTGKPIYPSPDTLKALSKAYDYPYEKLLATADYLPEAEENVINPSDLKGLLRLRFAKSNLPANIKEHHLQSILNEIEFVEKLEKEKYGDDDKK